ncbi:hypothetical protein HER39_12805, partial [Arthrobacter deserti]|nr:hypothetical protein [Arthrobacter deserti]
MLPLVVEIGRSIEAQLLASRADGERVFFDVFLRMQRRFRGAVIGVTKSLYVANTQARALAGEADEDLLRRLAEEAGVRSRTGSVRRRLSSGHTVSIQITPVDQAPGDFAAVLTLEPEAEPAGIGFARLPFGDGGALRPDYRDQLRQALASEQPGLLTGGRGTGKRFAAAAALARHGAGAVEADGAVAHLDPQAWLKALQAAAGNPAVPLILSHVEEIPLELMTTVADLVARAQGPLVGTSSEQMDEDSTAVFVRESFPVVVPVPPLRDRADEFSGLCRSILADFEAADGKATTFAPRTLAAPVANDWPGNIRQLRQGLATSRIRAAGHEIKLADLPARYGQGQAGRILGEMERV